MDSRNNSSKKVTQIAVATMDKEGKLAPLAIGGKAVGINYKGGSAFGMNAESALRNMQIADLFCLRLPVLQIVAHQMSLFVAIYQMVALLRKVDGIEVIKTPGRKDVVEGNFDKIDN